MYIKPSDVCDARCMKYSHYPQEGVLLILSPCEQDALPIVIQ